MISNLATSRLVCRNVSIKTPDKNILDGVDFELAPGELVGIIGSNGAGKSSLLKSMIGLIKGSSGLISLGERKMASMTPGEQARLVSYLAQGQQINWPQTVERVVSLGRIPHVRDSVLDARIIRETMRQVEVHHLAKRNVQTLSGGERARVLLARALAVQAPFLLADEPLAALDPSHQLRIMQLLLEQAHEGLAVAVVLHDLSLAMRFCTRIVVLHQGKKIADAKPDIACSDAILAQAFGIDVARASWNSNTFAVPWAICER
ncbi:ABC transporter ATP-binding protein [Comamonas testosteroni]|uniref:ABC transporter ATP-binding protein n=1 Tax=Comamonas testosteroni TaxID=285 RepID=UPI0015FCF0CD|nr:ABC transporter ATP-binding protein [Comamonas testosteroni]